MSRSWKLIVGDFFKDRNGAPMFHSVWKHECGEEIESFFNFSNKIEIHRLKNGEIWLFVYENVNMIGKMSLGYQSK